MLTMNRVEAANALNTPLANALVNALSALPAATRCLVLTGEGAKAFCAGADLKERRGMETHAWEEQHRCFRAARDALLHCPLPIIAAVNGAAFGGGLELALACDFIYAAEHARFAASETTLGIIPGMGGTQTLPRAAGLRRARECLYTGAPFSANEAYAWGMVNRVLPAGELLPAALETATRIAGNAPLAVQAAKRVVNGGTDLKLEDAFALELKEYGKLLDTQDRHEGIEAFSTKRRPVFKGS